MPAVDQTSYTVPSARAIIALLNASETLHDQQYRKVAIRALGFLADKMMGANGAFSYYDPQKKSGMLEGRLEDNAWMAAAFLRAYEVTADKQYLDLTMRIMQFAEKNLYDPAAGGFFTRRSPSGELYRDGELFDKTKNLTHNGVMAAVLMGLYEQTKEPSWLAMLEGTAGYFFSEVAAGLLKADSPAFHRVAQWLDALQKQRHLKKTAE